MSGNDPDEPQPEPQPESQPESPAFELETPTFEVTEKADKSAREYRDLHPDQ